MPEHLLDSREVAGFLHVSRSYAYDLMRSGLLPTVHLGKSVRVHPRDLDKYVDYLRRTPKRRRTQSAIYNPKSRV